MRPLSIRARLTLWYAGIIAASFMLLAGAFWLALQHSIYRTIVRNLQGRLQAFRYYLEQQQHEEDSNDLAQEIAEDINAVTANSVVRISSGKGGWIYRSQAAQLWSLPIPVRTNLLWSGQLSTFETHGELYRIISAPLPIGVIQIAISVSNFRDMQTLLAATLGVSSPLLLLLVSMGGYWMSGIALRPVDDLTKRAQGINAKNLSDRLPLRGTHDQLDRLAETLNGMLSRLESAFSRIATFTADASHELRTPLAIVRTTADVMRSKSRDPAEHEAAWGSIISQTDRMSQLVDDLLLLARADSASEVPRGELIDAVAVIRQTCAEIEVIAKSVGVGIALDVPDECTVFCDTEDLRRILLVLLDNAIKYSRKSATVLIQLAIEQSEEDRNVVIRVNDTGIGIPAEDLPLIFDRFYRAAKDRSRKTGGAGLGLSIARYLAGRRNGSIQAQSAPETGTTFTLKLPL